LMHDVGDLVLARLKPVDVSALWSLHSFARSHAPHGFLAARERALLEGIVRGEVPGVAVGAYAGDRLVGYSLSRRLTTDEPLAIAMGFSVDSAYVGLGTVVHPEWTGHILMARLLRLRGASEIEAGSKHVVGLIDVRNHASVANALRAGAALVGTLRDATSLNWVAYAGRWFDPSMQSCNSMTADAGDLEEQGRLFSRGWGAVGLQVRPRRQLVFRQLPRDLCGLGLDGWTVPE
jgi:hypothetical protein